MSTPSDSFDIGAIRELLMAAFTAEKLQRFCQDRTTFRPIVDTFGPRHGFDDMVDEVIDYCRTQLLFPDLLDQVREYNPRQFEKHAARLYSVDALSEDALAPVGAPPAQRRKLDPQEIKAACSRALEQKVIVSTHYNPSIYSPREMEGTFERFTHSDKRCLAIVGNSGMGKSMLLHHLAMQYAEQHACGVIFQASDLQADARFLRQTIPDSFAANLAELSADDFWSVHLNGTGPPGRPFVAFLVGLDKHRDPEGLLRAVNDLLIQEPGFRAVLSCHKETWHSIWASLRSQDALPRDYYYGIQTHREVQEGVSKTTTLGPYTDRELEDAYRKLELKPEWEEVQKDKRVKEWLRAPLMLWIVAEIYASESDREIPVYATSYEVMERYLEYIAAETESDKTEDTLLQIAALMHERRKTALSKSELEEQAISLEPGTIAHKLIGMGVLEYSTPDSKEQPALRFSKNRLLEFLLFRQLASRMSSAELDSQALRGLIDEGYDFVFMWGALQYWIASEWPLDALRELSEEDSPYVRSFLVRLCQTQFYEFQERIHDFIEASLESENVERKRFALAAALAVPDWPVLEDALMDENAAIQFLAAEYVEYMYDEDYTEAIEFLRGLSQKVRKGLWGIKSNFNYAISLGYLTLLLGPKLIEEQDKAEEIRDIWAEMLRQIDPVSLFVAGEQGRGLQFALDIVIELAVPATIRAFNRNEGGWFDGIACEEFFEMPLDQRQRAASLAPYVSDTLLDDEGSQRLFEASQVDNGVFFTIVKVVLANQCFMDWENTQSRAIMPMFQRGNSISRGSAIAGLGMYLEGVPAPSPEQLYFFISYVNYYARKPPYGRMTFKNRDKPGWVPYFFGRAAYHWSRLPDGQDDTRLLAEYLGETLWDATDPSYFDDVANDLALLATATEIDYVFDTIEYLYDRASNPRHATPEVCQNIYRVAVKALSQLYMKYPTEVDGFLETLAWIGTQAQDRITMDLLKQEQSLYAGNLMSDRVELFSAIILRKYPAIRDSLFRTLIGEYILLKDYPTALRRLIRDVLSTIGELLDQD